MEKKLIGKQTTIETRALGMKQIIVAKI